MTDFRMVTSGAAAILCVGLLACVPAGAPDDGKLPLTTSSEEAKNLYLRGRDLMEKLRFTDAREFYEEAAAEDPEFAMAHLALASTATGNEEFFAALQAAVEASDRVSEGERHLILAAQAQANGNPTEQYEHLAAVVAAYPEDERARNALGNYHFGRQEYEKSIEHYEKATALDPGFSQPYNQLGYAYRFLGRYDEAERALLSYIELIPEEPNPYDSYAELLMEQGRYEESIENYEKALERNPRFVPSYVGIGNNLVLLDRGDEARAKLEELLNDVARNDRERRQALFRIAGTWLHEGDVGKALETLEQQYAIVEQTGDFGAMAAVLVTIGNVLLETGSPEEAASRYAHAVEINDMSNAGQKAKDNFGRNQLYRQARVALALGDLDEAQQLATAHAEAIRGRDSAFQEWQQHDLQARVAMEQGDFDAALEQLTQANQRNPQILYLTALAFEGKGDGAAAHEALERAANFNGLAFSYGYVRTAAREKLARG